MAKQLKYYPREELSAYLENHMVNDSYDFPGMVCLYTDLFSRKGIYGVFLPMKEKAFRSYLIGASRRKNAFLKIKGSGARIAYSRKREPLPTPENYLDDLAFTSKIKMSKYYEKANDIYARGKELLKCRK